MSVRTNPERLPSAGSYYLREFDKRAASVGFNLHEVAHNLRELSKALAMGGEPEVGKALSEIADDWSRAAGIVGLAIARVRATREPVDAIEVLTPSEASRARETALAQAELRMTRFDKTAIARRVGDDALHKESGDALTGVRRGGRR